MKLRVVNPEAVIPDARVCAEAALRGIEILVIDNLRMKNEATKPNRYGMPKTNYYDEAAKSVSAETAGSSAVITIDHPGIAKHYEGGTVMPKNKALAIPIDPSVAGIWPSELPGELDLIWPKTSSHGFLKDPTTSDLLYLLISRAEISADETVLPPDAAIVASVENALTEMFS